MPLVNQSFFFFRLNWMRDSSIKTTLFQKLSGIFTYSRAQFNLFVQCSGLMNHLVGAVLDSNPLTCKTLHPLVLLKSTFASSIRLLILDSGWSVAASMKDSFFSSVISVGLPLRGKSTTFPVCFHLLKILPHCEGEADTS